MSRTEMSASTVLTAPDLMPIALRAFTAPEQSGGVSNIAGLSGLRPSNLTLVFDCETSTDAAQRLRFGAYQIRKGDRLHERGLFYEPDALSPEEVNMLSRWTSANQLRLLTRAEFVEGIFFPIGYDNQASIVGLNLPFDLSRIAIAHGSARGKMRGGFSFILSPSTRRPRAQVKHLSARAALIRFTHPGKQLTPRGMRRRMIQVQPHRGFFVDVKTLAAALTSSSHSLASLGKFLGIQHRKLEVEEHGGPLTADYIGYAVQDVQATWECYRELLRRYHAHGLTETAAHKIKSEAGVGKAYLRQMGISPWRQLQPECPPELIGIIMSTYYGGRSEVRIRRKLARVLYCDFLSMYPTVCTLMGLWKFVIANKMIWHDSTIETRELLDKSTIADLHDPQAWARLATLVRIAPQCDILPVRAPYGGESQSTIGLNFLTSEKAQWFTLADCIASKLLNGRPPRVLEAITFEPEGLQAGLQSVSIGGREAYRVDPTADDFYRTIIDLRSAVKDQIKEAKKNGTLEEIAHLNSLQLALKILANATSYGIFMELNVEELDGKDTVRCYGMDRQSFSVQTNKLETPGTYFHPLLATLITGAARLMLALTERLVLDAGIDWAFCDTDSMAPAQPANMPEAEFLERAQAVRSWFEPLNPYKAKGELLKLEDANLVLDSSGAMEPLFCFAISAKRYVLFNLDSARRPVIRKASAHGLGHLMAPYPETDAPATIPAPRVSLADIGVERWQYDLWCRIVSAALAGHPDSPDLDFHPALNQPAISRYGATTPALLRWFDSHNRNRPYTDQVRPFGFMTALHGTRNVQVQSAWEQEPSAKPRKLRRIRPIAPYHKEPAAAAAVAFDRETGQAVPARQLATYREALAQYHLHPEAKFLGGDFIDRGPTRRRHIQVLGITYIGKEANRWEEQFFLGADEGAVISYGAAPWDREAVEERVRQACHKHGQRAMARASKSSLRDVSMIMGGGRKVSQRTLARLDRVARSLAMVP